MQKAQSQDLRGLVYASAEGTCIISGNRNFSYNILHCKKLIQGCQPQKQLAKGKIIGIKNLNNALLM